MKAKCNDGVLDEEILQVYANKFERHESNIKNLKEALEQTLEEPGNNDAALTLKLQRATDIIKNFKADVVQFNLVHRLESNKK